MKKLTFLKKVFVEQHDHKDCGVACLLTAIGWYGYSSSLEFLRDLSGTTTQGTSILGLQQASSEIGFESEAYKADLSSLEKANFLSILHVTKHKVYNHYVLCCGKEDGLWLIADPEDGVLKLTDDELAEIWTSGVLLKLGFEGDLKLTVSGKKNFYHWLLPLFERHKNKLIIILILGFTNTLLLFSTSIFTEQLVDVLLPSNNLLLIKKGVITWSSLLFLSLSLTYIRGITLAQLSHDFNIDLTKSFLDRLLFLPKRFFVSKKIGDLVTRLDDVENIEETATRMLETGLLGMFAIGISLVVMFIYDVHAGIINLLFVPVLFTCVVLARKNLLLTQKQALVGRSLNNANYIDTIGGIDEIKWNNLANRFIDKALGVYKTYRGLAFKSDKVNLSFEVNVRLVIFLTTVLIVGISSFKVLNGNLEIGNMLAIISITSLGSSYTVDLALTYVNLEQARIAFDRMHELIDQETEAEKTNNGNNPLEINFLQVDNLSFSYPGQLEILEDVSFALEKGNIYTLIGENGSGKSTLINLLTMLYRPTSGQIKLNGMDYQSSPIAWREMVGVVPQSIKVFNASLWENIDLSSIGNEEGEGRERVTRLISLHDFHDKFENLPFGIDTILGEGGVELSGGQKQIMGLLRALINRPKILLLDETTAQLDKASKNQVLDLLNHLKADMIILHITHDSEAIMNSDLVYLLKDQTVKTIDSKLVEERFLDRS